MNAKKTKVAMRYDGNLQMFCEPAQEPRFEMLHFMRWLGEHGRLEHPIAGEPAGEYVERAAQP
jgi:hypothetical protein